VWIKRVLTSLIVLVAAGVALLLLLWVSQRRLIYLPDPTPPLPPPEASVVPVETSDGIHHQAWELPAEGEAVARVMVFNGNAGNKGLRVPLARSLADEGMQVVLFDYRGYGGTVGDPSEVGLLRDARAVSDVAFDTDLPVVYLGESLGAGVAAALALERPPTALVLRSPFTSLADMARTHYPLVPARLLLRDHYDTEAIIAAVDVPVLVILGTRDSIVPPELSRRVFEAATEPKEVVELEGLDHNEPDLTSGTELAAAIRRFLDDVR